MSIKMMNAVWEWDAKEACKGIKIEPHSVKAVALCLADHHNDKTKRCNPSHKRISSRCSMSERTVVRAISALEEAGVLSVYRWHKPDGSRGRNEYTLHFGGTVTESLGDEGVLSLSQHPYCQEVTRTVSKTPSVPLTGSSWAGTDQELQLLNSDAEQFQEDAARPAEEELELIPF